MDKLLCGSVYYTQREKTGTNSSVALCTRHRGRKHGQTPLWLCVLHTEGENRDKLLCGSVYYTQREKTGTNSSVALCTTHRGRKQGQTPLWLCVLHTEGENRDKLLCGSVYYTQREKTGTISSVALCTRHRGRKQGQTPLWLCVLHTEGENRDKLLCGSVYYTQREKTRTNSSVANSSVALCTTHKGRKQGQTPLWLCVLDTEGENRDKLHCGSVYYTQREKTGTNSSVALSTMYHFTGRIQFDIWKMCQRNIADFMSINRISTELCFHVISTLI